MAWLAWMGPSRLDGSQVQVLVAETSLNAKTGDMRQVAFVPKVKATRQGTGRRMKARINAVCPPSCGLIKACYAWLGTAHMGSVSMARSPGGPEPAGHKPTRLGSQGDPGSVPLSVIKRLVRMAGRVWTGYTHMWRARPGLRRFCMASVDTLAEAMEARARGWRFALVLKAGEPVPEGAIVCPATEEAGKRTTCAKCGLCNGKSSADDRRKDIIFYVHGPSKARFGGDK